MKIFTYFVTINFTSSSYNPFSQKQHRRGRSTFSRRVRLYQPTAQTLCLLPSVRRNPTSTWTSPAFTASAAGGGSDKLSTVRSHFMYLKCRKSKNKSSNYLSSLLYRRNAEVMRWTNRQVPQISGDVRQRHRTVDNRLHSSCQYVIVVHFRT